MVEKLKKYDVCLVSDGFSGYVNELQESPGGEFFKAEDVEPILNSLQQLKAEIRSVVDDFVCIPPVRIAQEIDNLIYKLRELSAV